MSETLLKNLHLEKQNYGGCCDNEIWTNTTDQGNIDSMNPSDESFLGKVYCCGKKDYEIIAEKAYRTFLQWREIPAPQRGELIRQIGITLREKKSELGKLVSLEMGKSLQEGLGEVQEMIDMADLAVGQARMLYGHSMHSERPRHRMYEQWHPLGPIAVISAFNFPVAVWAWNAFLAAICGNTIIWKPSSKTPLCAIAVQHICNEVMQKNNVTGIFNLFISNNPDISELLIKDKRIPLVSFTGSSRVGVHVYETVAKRMGRCLLECSGNNAIIVDESADLKLAIPAIVFGAVGTAGQRCTSTRRLFIQKTHFSSVVEKLVSAYQKLKIGDPLDSKNHVGPLIDQAAVMDFQKAVQCAKKQGGNILVGGKVLSNKGFYVEPTIIQAENQWPIVQHETFAPILYVMSYDHFDEAIELQNGVEQGLSSALFTMNIKHAEQFLSTLGSDCGIANINIGTSGAEIGGAFGGEKSTGGGREAGSDAWKYYMRRQTNTINWSSDFPLAQGIKFNL